MLALEALSAKGVEIDDSRILLMAAKPIQSSLRIEFLFNQNHRQIGTMCLDERGNSVKNGTAIARLCDSSAFEPRKVWTTWVSTHKSE